MNHKQIRWIGILSLLALALLLAGCDRSAPPIAAPTNVLSLSMTPSLIPAPTAVPTRVTPGATAVIASTVVPATPTPQRPATTVVPPLSTPLPPATPTPTRVLTGRTMNVKIYLIKLNDNGAAGPKVGCNDSAVGVTRTLPYATTPLTDALKDLLANHDQTYGQSGLYNALYRSRLEVASVSIVNAKATIKLTGNLSLAGECDDPRVEAQLKYTALQFSTVRDVAVFINGKPLSSLLGGK